MSTHPLNWPDYREFKTAWVRDLCWLLDPSFDLSVPSSPYPAFAAGRDLTAIHWLETLDDSHCDLVTSPVTEQRENQRLGHYFEDLVAYYLQHCPSQSVKNLQRNVALRTPLEHGNGVNTLGELDFLYERDRQWHHLEVAVKFYLAVERRGERIWLGPNCKDQLDIKWRRMLTHQLPLGQIAAPGQNVQSQFWLKGLLFEPFSSLSDETEPTNRLHWVHLKDLPAYLHAFPGDWVRLKKLQWLGADREPLPQNNHELFNALQQHFTQKNFAIMLKNQNSKVEHRCFIVNNAWPEPTINILPESL